MNVNVIPTPNFQREAKKLIKKYRSLKSELEEFTTQLEQNPTTGTQIHENVFKIRLAVKSKGKGKSGGLRIITFIEFELVKNDNTVDVYLLSIYDKSARANVTNQFLKKLIEEIKAELEESFEEE